MAYVTLKKCVKGYETKLCSESLFDIYAITHPTNLTFYYRATDHPVLAPIIGGGLVAEEKGEGPQQPLPQPADQRPQRQQVVRGHYPGSGEMSSRRLIAISHQEEGEAHAILGMIY